MLLGVTNTENDKKRVLRNCFFEKYNTNVNVVPRISKSSNCKLTAPNKIWRKHKFLNRNVLL